MKDGAISTHDPQPLIRSSFCVQSDYYSSCQHMEEESNVLEFHHYDEHLKVPAHHFEDVGVPLN
jgi:hypothetical protein